MIKKEYILLAVLSAGFSFPVQGQTTWTKQDSIKLKEILDGTTDISINPTVKQEIDLLFSTPAQIHSIPILPVEELLPKPENLRQIYAIPGFRLDITTPNDGINIYWTLSDSVSQPLRNMAKEQRYFYSKRQISNLTSLKSSAIIFTQAIAAAAVNPPYCREQ